MQFSSSLAFNKITFKYKIIVLFGAVGRIANVVSNFNKIVTL